MRLIYPRSKVVIFGVILILVVVLIAFIKAPSVLKENSSKKTVSLAPSPKTADPCTQFLTDKGEISCAEARKIALAKYPGQLLSIDNTTLQYQSGKPPKTKTENRKVFVAHIKPNNLKEFPQLPKSPNSKEMQILETIGVVIDQNTKEILFIQTFFKK